MTSDELKTATAGGVTMTTPTTSSLILSVNDDNDKKNVVAMEEGFGVGLGHPSTCDSAVGSSTPSNSTWSMTTTATRDWESVDVCVVSPSAVLLQSSPSLLPSTTAEAAVPPILHHKYHQNSHTPTLKRRTSPMTTEDAYTRMDSSTEVFNDEEELIDSDEDDDDDDRFVVMDPSTNKTKQKKKKWIRTGTKNQEVSEATDHIELQQVSHEQSHNTKQHQQQQVEEQEEVHDKSVADTATVNHTVGTSSAKAAPIQQQQHEPLADDYLFTSSSSSTLSNADLQICQRLDQEYERALEERDIGYHARYASVRQSACCSFLFMICFLTIGTMFFTTQAGWQIRDALFFSIYTMTTVGYGLNDAVVPNHTEFQLFVICYIFVGIATLTIMVAQVYQLVQLEASRAQHARDHADNLNRNSTMMRMSTMMMMRGKHGGATTIARGDASDDTCTSTQSTTTFRRSIFSTLGRPASSPIPFSRGKHYPRNHLNPNPSMMDQQDDIVPSQTEILIHHFFRCYDRIKRYCTHSDIGRGISVVFPFAGLILIGAVVVGPIEGWTVVESIYFSVVSLTTVGYGLYVPQNPIAIYFCILWLPFSVGFMSLFLGNVAAFYIRMSDKNIARLERQMRRRMQKAKEDAELQKLQNRLNQKSNNVMNHSGGSSNNNTNKIHSSRIHASGRMLTNRNALADAASSDDVIVRASEGLLPEHKSYHKSNHRNDDDDISIVSISTTGTNHTTSTHISKRKKRGDFEMLTEMDDTMTSTTNTSILSSINRPIGSSTSATTGNSTTATTSTSNDARRHMILANSNYRHSSSLRKNDYNNHNHKTSTNFANDNHSIDKNEAGDTSSSSQTMQTMRDILRAVHQTLSQSKSGGGATISSSSSSSIADGDDVSTRSNIQYPKTATMSNTSAPRTKNTTRSKSTKPAFSLRVLVQERFAEIIATDIAGFQSRMEIKDTTLSVTIDTLSSTADKWFIPRRARKAFRSVAFEALYFVGEHGLITRGPDALYDLTPFEFHGLFSPLLAAMGDAHTMETWLANTNVLAEVDLKLHAM